MLIQVTYTDESFDYVKDFMLDAMIASGSITRFRRSTGWVEVASASIRRAQPEGGYNGVERRVSDDRRVIDRRILERRSDARDDGDRREHDRRNPLSN